MQKEKIEAGCGFRVHCICNAGCNANAMHEMSGAGALAFLEGASPGPQGASQQPSIREEARTASLHGYAIKTALLIIVS